MAKLFFYLLRTLGREAGGLYVVAFFIVWIIQALRLFDLITAKGQGLVTLIAQAFFNTPALGKGIIVLCIGIGVARTMRAMQQSRELHTIHAARRLRALWSALVVFIAGGALFAALVAHVLEPLSRFENTEWSLRVAADILGRTLEPGRFNEITPGLVTSIGGRLPDGSISDFFADDRRDPDDWRTYTAASATIAADENGYYVQLRDGTLQFQREGEDFTQVVFSSYELGLNRIAMASPTRDTVSESTTPEILARAAGRPLNLEESSNISARIADSMRVIAIGVLMAALTAFPHARRGRSWMPPEVWVAVFTLGEKAIADQWRLPVTGHSTVAVIIIAVALILLIVRFQAYRFRPLFGARA